LHPVLVERLGDLFLPVRTELVDTARKRLTELVQQLPSDLVSRRRRSNGRAKVAKRDRLQHCNCGLGAIEPDCFTHCREHLLGDGDDGLGVLDRASLGLSSSLLLGE